MTIDYLPEPSGPMEQYQYHHYHHQHHHHHHYFYVKGPEHDEAVASLIHTDDDNRYRVSTLISPTEPTQPNPT